MNNLDDIVKSSKYSNTKPFNKEEWKQKKQEELKKAYSLIDKTAEDIINDNSKFQKYLDIQSHFDKYSVGNALLITAQYPEATQLKEYSEWEKVDKDFSVKKGNTALALLKPGNAYTKADGTQMTPYIVYKVFDIAQTTIKKIEVNKSIDEKLLIKSFIHDCPVDIKVVDELESSKCAEFKNEESILYIKRGSETKSLLQDIVSEITKSELSSDNKDIDKFKAKCVSYMVCKKYGIDVSNFDFKDIPDSYKNMETKDLRNELCSIKNSVDDFNNRINDSLESTSKKPKNKDYER